MDGRAWAPCPATGRLEGCAVAERRCASVQEWDVVIDFSRQPGHVRRAVAALCNRASRFVFVSSGNVYADHSTPGQDEDAALLPPLHGDGRLARGEAVPGRGGCRGSAAGTVANRHATSGDRPVRRGGRGVAASRHHGERQGDPPSSAPCSACPATAARSTSGCCTSSNSPTVSSAARRLARHRRHRRAVLCVYRALNRPIAHGRSPITRPVRNSSARSPTLASRSMPTGLGGGPAVVLRHRRTELFSRSPARTRVDDSVATHPNTKARATLQGARSRGRGSCTNKQWHPARHAATVTLAQIRRAAKPCTSTAERTAPDDQQLGGR